MRVPERIWSALLFLLSSSTLDARSRVSTPDIEAEILLAQERASHELLPVASVGTIIAAVAVYAVLRQRVPVDALLFWLTLRCAVSVVRLVHSTLWLQGVIKPSKSGMPLFAFMAMLDGLVWSALGWYFTPLSSLEVAVISIGMLIGVASIGAMMLQVNLPAAVLFVLTVLVPNALYSLGRGDDLGTFCFGCVMGLALLLMVEARRSNRRIVEMLRLRFESEQVSQAKTQALQQAKLLSETKSRFVATMSHEMRTPLHGIIGLLRQMRRDASEPLAIKRLNLLEGSGEHLLNVINDVLDFSRIEAGGLPIHAQAFGLHALLSELAETSRVSCEEKGLSLNVQLDVAEAECVNGDPTRVRQILHNLLGNAIKFTQQGEVRLHVWRDMRTHRMVFEVADTGIGIAAQELSRVFDAFHQAEGTYKRRFGGTGLGLTISKDLCMAMGGNLTCRSEPGRGSVFTFDLPLPGLAGRAASVEAGDAQAIPLPSDQSADGHPWQGGSTTPHVLLVEDNPVNALVAEAELLRLGVQVTVVDTGHQALDWLEQQQPDLVLMDCEMPVMDGIETTRRIRERERQKGQSGLRIVALTANGPETFAERCKPVGMNDHLSKPFRPEDLARILARHLRRPVVAVCA
ncbi:MAG: response regulator [Aquabacterium sp.]|uniref:ATP-binding protein n=1 Tax=Aquabacterium sp. TaxID=1872578 RepID=UPI0025C0AC0F|nr:ATP-binding protein [Aquabacterium sp.]MBI3383712.1 response regulator [Aquabacterium sp.]